jgi:hypothetical protein
LAQSGEIVVNPGLKSTRDRSRLLPALQREVAGAYQVAHYAVADPNRQAPQPHSGPRAVRLHPLGSRGLETGYVGWIAIRQPVSEENTARPRGCIQPSVIGAPGERLRYFFCGNSGRPRERHVAQSTSLATAVHIYCVRGHEFAGVGANEQHQLANLLRFAEALHRHIVEKCLISSGEDYAAP